MRQSAGIPSGFRLAAMAVLSLGLGACSSLVPTSSGPSAAPPPALWVPSTAKSSFELGLRQGPAVSELGLRQSDASSALLSFRESCAKLTTRTDSSGLTRPADWKPACDAFARWPFAQAASFFETFFETVQIGDGRSFATGYFEPEIAASRTRIPGYDTPVYALPPDLVRAKPGDAAPLPSGTMPLGRYDSSGRFVPYYDRGQIDGGALAGKGLEIAWVRDPVGFFFLQVQGSGRLRLPDGSIMRIGYAGQNGQAYTGIGAIMRERGLIGDGPGQYSGSMQGITQYIREHPAEGRALMRENRSWIFFAESTRDAPIGSLGVPIRAESSAAVDADFVPLGAPIWLDLDRTEANGLWIAQDTGGAIKGANRYDTFWGAGDEAGRIAGDMSGRGRSLIFVPKGTLTRLGAK